MATKGSAEGFATKRPDHSLSREQEMTTKGSAEGFAAKRPDHLLSEGRRLPPKGQEQALQQREQITYPLRVGDDHQRVNSNFC